MNQVVLIPIDFPQLAIIVEVVVLVSRSEVVIVVVVVAVVFKALRGKPLWKRWRRLLLRHLLCEWHARVHLLRAECACIVVCAVLDLNEPWMRVGDGMDSGMKSGIEVGDGMESGRAIGGSKVGDFALFPHRCDQIFARGSCTHRTSSRAHFSDEWHSAVRALGARATGQVRLHNADAANHHHHQQQQYFGLRFPNLHL